MRNPQLSRIGSRGVAIALLAVWCGSMAAPTVAADPPGKALYISKCAGCHGNNGEGTKEDYPHGLYGDRSIFELSRFIDKEMPKGSPDDCNADESKQIAEYIYTAFYSPPAQARINPPRVELSRLTVRQYRNAITDLMGSFRGTSKLDDRRGLHGEYYKGGRLRGERPIDRVDPQVQFDFGVQGPDKDKFDANNFSIRWEGAVIAPETGEYEFIVRTDHAVRLWINDPRKELIDRWVKSGKDNEFSERIYLLGGRAYPLKLEFSKAKQGVDDSKKQKGKPPEVKASIALLWKQPHRAVEVIPPHALRAGRVTESFVLTTPFPPDDRSSGYERGTAISKAWEQATTDAAIETTSYVMARLRDLAEVRDDGPKRAEKLRDFTKRFAERAFRRPLSDDEKKLFVDRQFEAAPDPDLGLKRALLLVLKSPRFLYTGSSEVRDGYDVAARLSFGLWDSLPDAALRDAAAAGKLATQEQVAAQAERMLADPRAVAKQREFLLQWLKADQVAELAKDAKQFVGFDAAAASDLRTSLELFLDEFLARNNPNFQHLLLADSVWLNGRLAKLYGVDLPADAPFQKVVLDPDQRAGVVTHPYLLADFAYTATSSPIHRGVFIARSLLGRSLRPPPIAVAPLAPEAHADLTTRLRVALQTNPAVCQSCHSLINPLGFTLEHFDAVGRYRKEESGKPIDASGVYETRTGNVVKFGGARDLAKFLADNEESQTAFVRQLFHYTVKQPVYAYGPETLPDLYKAFAANRFDLRKLQVEIMSRTALQSTKTKS